MADKRACALRTVNLADEEPELIAGPALVRGRIRTLCHIAWATGPVLRPLLKREARLAPASGPLCTRAGVPLCLLQPSYKKLDWAGGPLYCSLREGSTAARQLASCKVADSTKADKDAHSLPLYFFLSQGAR